MVRHDAEALYPEQFVLVHGRRNGIAIQYFEKGDDWDPQQGEFIAMLGEDLLVRSVKDRKTIWAVPLEYAHLPLPHIHIPNLYPRHTVEEITKFYKLTQKNR